MNRVFTLLGRLAIILVGYVAAVLAASATIHLLFLGSQGFSAGQTIWIITGSLIFSIPFVALFVAYFAFVPSVIAILLGEVLAARNWLFYAIAGAGVGLVVVSIFAYGANGMYAVSDAVEPGLQPENPDAGFPGVSAAMALIAGGIVAGVVYWVVAGRLAGSWRGPSQKMPISPEPTGS
jgi:hypothetical protein